ncbi:MAG: hypothetical protein G3H99_00465 [Ferrovum sp.]|nr:hypothetical protein [Ferrovum sp.]NDU87749.1 hypothetical protein [Ferrovum sp.]
MMQDQALWGGEFVLYSASKVLSMTDSPLMGRSLFRLLSWGAWFMVFFPLGMRRFWQKKGESVADEWYRWQRMVLLKRGVKILTFCGALAIFWPGPLLPGVIPACAMLFWATLAEYMRVTGF